MTLNEMTDYIENECENFHAFRDQYEPGIVFLSDDDGNRFKITITKEN